MHLSLWSMSIFVTCLPIFATVCRCPGLLCSGDIQKQSNGQGGIGVAFLFKPLDLDSGMAWNGMEWLCLKIWGGDETYIFRPQTQFVSMSIKSRCYGSATKRSEVLE